MMMLDIMTSLDKISNHIQETGEFNILLDLKINNEQSLS